MTKFFLFAAALLTGASLMAADFTPTAVYTVGNEETLGTSWASKGQPQNFIVKGDTVIFNAFLCYQSNGASPKQAWTGNKSAGSTGGTNEAMGCFPASSVWGTGDAGTKCATTRSTRTYYYNVTNCSAVQVLINNMADNRESYIKAFEMVEGVVSETATASVTRSENGLGIIELDGLDLTKTYQIQVNTNTDSNSNLFGIAFISTGGAQVTKYTVTYQNGETVLGSERVTEGETAANYANYQTVASTEFQGWFEDAALTIPADFSAAITANKTFYGKFIHVASNENLLKELWFTNGVKAYIVRNEVAATVKGCYLAGQAEPTVQSKVVSDGATFAQNGSTLTVTAENGEVAEYTMELTAVEPLVDFVSGETITYDTTVVDLAQGGYIYSIYGFDASKGVKWGKPVDDATNLRIREGKNRIYMFLPACDSVAFIGGSAGARDVEIRVNGVVNEVVKTPASSAQIVVKGMNNAAANMVSFESNGKTNGDSGFVGMIIYKDTPTGLSNVEAVKAQKMIVNGQMVIVRDGVMYNAQGSVIK